MHRRGAFSSMLLVQAAAWTMLQKLSSVRTLGSARHRQLQNKASAFKRFLAVPSFESRHMSDAPLATSVPWMPMATPMSAWFKAGASFTLAQLSGL